LRKEERKEKKKCNFEAALHIAFSSFPFLIVCAKVRGKKWCALWENDLECVPHFYYYIHIMFCKLTSTFIIFVYLFSLSFSLSYDPFGFLVHVYKPWNKGGFSKRRRKKKGTWKLSAIFDLLSFRRYNIH
jgi:hypothetical protein